jgi:hypothetical protein
MNNKRKMKKKIFAEHLLCVRHWDRFWVHNGENIGLAPALTPFIVQWSDNCTTEGEYMEMCGDIWVCIRDAVSRGT